MSFGIDNDAVMRAAHAEVDMDPVATSWVDHVLRNHLDRKHEIRDLPPALASKAHIDQGDQPLNVIQMRALVRMLAAAVADRKFRDEARVLRVSVQDAIGFADLSVRQQLKRETFTSSDVERIKAATPTTEWLPPRYSSRSATSKLGPLAVNCNFYLDDNGAWEFGWSLSVASERSLQNISARGVDGRRGSGSGLFPCIDKAVRSVIAEFLEQCDPECLIVRGSDPKRNAHYAASYGSISPEGYELVPMRQGSSRAGPDGIDGISLIKVREPIRSLATM